MNVLISVAHPDDEVLGCGGTASVLAAAGHQVTTCILSGGAEARQQRPEDDELLADTVRAQELLGAGEPIMGSFPNIRLNSVPHIELVQFVEEAIMATQADVIFTHHPGDVNNDHVHTSLATQAAARLHQRGPSAPPLTALYFMEVLSSTDWGFAGGSPPFVANAYREIGEAGLSKKLEALDAYRDVMRPYPHPRSEEAVRALAVLRGAESGLNLAEAFSVGYSRLAD